MNPEHATLFWVVVVGAALAPYLARRVRLPAAAVEILYGLWLFHGPISRIPSWLPFLEELGLLYLLFLGGLELDLRVLARSARLRGYIVLPAVSLGITPLAFFAAGWVPYHGLAVAVVSAGMVMPALREGGATRTSFGRDALGLALVGEVLAILALTGVDTWRLHGLSVEALIVLGKLAGCSPWPRWLSRRSTSSGGESRLGRPDHDQRRPAEEGVRGPISPGSPTRPSSVPQPCSPWRYRGANSRFSSLPAPSGSTCGRGSGWSCCCRRPCR